MIEEPSQSAAEPQFSDAALGASQAEPALAAISATRPSFQPECTLTVVGGGFCGTLAVIHALRQIRSLVEPLGSAKSAKIKIDWFDRAGRFCHGMPYDMPRTVADENVFILNQPARQMSPFSDQPNLFVDWLQKLTRENPVANPPKFDGASFAPRAYYGVFLEELLAAELRQTQDAGVTIDLRPIESKVSRIIRQPSGYLVEAQSHDPPRLTDSVILALGHVQSDNFKHLASAPGYINYPFEVDLYRKALQQVPEARRCLLIGGGPTSLDAIRALEHLGYRGHYQVICSERRTPWKYDAELYTPESFTNFKPKWLTPEHIKRSPRFTDLLHLLKKEVAQAKLEHKGAGHVYFGINLPILFYFNKDNENLGSLRKFIQHVNFLRGALTPPENIALRDSLNGGHRRQVLVGRAEPQETTYDPKTKRFRVQVRTHRGHHERCAFGELLVNCTVLSRNAASRCDPSQGVRIQAPGAGNPIYERQVGIFRVGPPANFFRDVPKTWGVESFRDEIREATQMAIANSLMRFYDRMVGDQTKHLPEGCEGSGCGECIAI